MAHVWAQRGREASYAQARAEASTAAVGPGGNGGGHVC